MIKIILALLTIYKLSSGLEECDFVCPADSNVCPLTQFDSSIECKDFDCCQCTSIECGNDADGVCKNFIANGAFSAFNIPIISVIGDSDTIMGCNGDSSCDHEATKGRTKITASGIKKLDCLGVFACRDAVIAITDPAEDFEVQCNEPDSCQGLELTVTTDSNTLQSFKGIACDSTAACQYAMITMINDDVNPIIEELKCAERGSCFGATIIMKNVKKIICAAEFSCYDANIEITDPADDFEIQCLERNSCQELKLTVTITDISLGSWKTIRCEAPAACQDAEFTFINNDINDNAITIEELNCMTAGSCRGAQFIIDDTSTSSTKSVSFETCKFGETGACLDTVFTGVECPAAP